MIMRGLRALGDAGTDALPPPTTPPAGQVTLDTSACPGTAWVNNSVTNVAGSNKGCMIDYSTGQAIAVDPTTGVDAVGRPFWCHMPSIAGGQSPAAMPWICGTPAQRAATPDLATYRKQQGIPDPNDPMAYFNSTPAPSGRASGFPAPGSAPPPPPEPIFQQMAEAQQGLTVAAHPASSSGGVATGVAAPTAMPNIVGSANGTAQAAAAVAPAAQTSDASTSSFSLSSTEIFAIAGIGLLVLYSMHRRQTV